jgi:hypothetical protein
MQKTKQFMAMLAIAGALVFAPAHQNVFAVDNDLIPAQFTKEQRDNLTHFLQKHGKPDRFIPADAKIVSSQPAGAEINAEATPGKPIKQYMVQIAPHRPVPGQEEVKRADVIYYRPNPEKGKPGITVKHTVDLDTGAQVGPTEVLLNAHTPMSREELFEAVDLAREKSSAVGTLYKDRDKTMVRWEYLQLMINRKHGQTEPGDRVVRLVFNAPPLDKDQEAPAPVRVIVNLTKGVVTADDR